jgi:protein phosphatase
VGELMRLGIISADKIRTHPRRSFITRSIGGQTAVQAMTRTGEVRDDDMFVLCTDGVWEPVEESDMQRILTSMTPEEACHEMVKLGIERDVRDNLSIQILKVLSVPEGQSRVTITTQGGLMARLMDFFGRK